MLEPLAAALLCLLPFLAPNAHARAQAPFPVGTRDVVWANTTGQGSASLTARVLYPATSAGTNTPILPLAGGWPTIVFLHGFAVTGNVYGPLGDAWAREGFVVVLSNTAQFDNVGQEYDGRALFFALQAAHTAVGGPFQGAIDLQRVALAGHSMGGGNVANVLAINPGYRSGMAIAPVPPRGNNGALVLVPLGIVAGTGDTITPPASNAQPFYQSLTNYRDLKFLYLLNGDATHTNMPGLFVSGATATAVFARTAAVGLAFVRHTLSLSPSALDEAIGPPALAEPRLVALSQEFADTQVWTNAPLALGTVVRASVGCEPGLGGLGVAPLPLVAPVPTPIGELRLDPGSAFLAFTGVATAARRLDASIGVPNSAVLVGSIFAMQALGPTRTQALWLGRAIAPAIVP